MSIVAVASPPPQDHLQEVLLSHLRDSLVFPLEVAILGLLFSLLEILSHQLLFHEQLFGLEFLSQSSHCELLMFPLPAATAELAA